MTNKTSKLSRKVYFTVPIILIFFLLISTLSSFYDLGNQNFLLDTFLSKLGFWLSLKFTIVMSYYYWVFLLWNSTSVKSKNKVSNLFKRIGFIILILFDITLILVSMEFITAIPSDVNFPFISIVTGLLIVLFMIILILTPTILSVNSVTQNQYGRRANFFEMIIGIFKILVLPFTISKLSKSIK
ncbi:hypothetical protein BC781_1194 [Sediminitomix flava]|uniref:Uncharacterized protein n=1 Tax=Sediminitomix flava TaxID=379075 RepID=A0A315YVS0_SEDFL|nr:hypothetical protein BC781_1194 [Sediminitomix flava]